MAVSRKRLWTAFYQSFQWGEYDRRAQEYDPAGHFRLTGVLNDDPGRPVTVKLNPEQAAHVGREMTRWASEVQAVRARRRAERGDG